MSLNLDQFARDRAEIAEFPALSRTAAALTLACLLASAFIAVAGDSVTRSWYAAGVLLLVPGVWIVERRRAAEQEASARLIRQCQTLRGFKAALTLVLDALTSACHARGARVIVRGPGSGPTIRWAFVADGRSLSWTDDSRSRSLPPAAHDCLRAEFAAGEWTGVVEIVGLARNRSRRSVRLLTRMVRELAPVLCAAYMQSSVRARVSQEERAHLARELHDGPIQSLIGAEMSLEALRRQAPLNGTPAALDRSLNEAQRILRQEIVSLRELMVRTKPLDLSPGSLPTYLARAVRRFSHESGIRAEFVADDRPAPALPRQHAAALARIVHEALANVRKHSEATRVVVILQKDADATRLVIHDNGRGFDSTRSYGPPEVIDDSVRALGGALTIDSAPGRGARLDIVVPAAAAPPAFRQVAS